MAVQTLPVNIDLTVYSGTTFRRNFRWKPAGVPQDFTGWSASFRFGPPKGQPVLILDEGTGVEFGVDGTFSIVITNDRTGMLPVGIFTYVLDLTEVYGDVTRLLRGRLTVIRDLEPN